MNQPGNPNADRASSKGLAKGSSMNIIASMEKTLGRKLGDESAMCAPNGQVVYLLIDVSGSMAGDQKLDGAKRGALAFARDARKQGWSVGCISFSDHVAIRASHKANVPEFEAQVQSLKLEGSTPMASAVSLATATLTESKARSRAICLVTDGGANDPAETLDAARQAKSLGIEILAIGTEDADHAFLAQLVTRKTLHVRVAGRELASGVGSMSRLLLSQPQPHALPWHKKSDG